MKRFVVVLAAVLATTALLCACGGNVTFDGSKTGDANHFDMDFEVLNTTYTHDLVMKEGEWIDVSVECLKGNISLIIQKDDEDPVYRGSNMKTTDFRVGIVEDGTYTLTVSGEKAKGRVDLERIEALQ